MTLRVMSWLVLTAIAGACGNQPAPAETRNASGSSAAPAAKPTPATPATPTPPAPTPPAPTPPAPGAPSSLLESKPFVLTCGDQPLKLPPPAAMPAALVERPLAHDRPISVCRDQKSPEAVCTCLVRAIATWADGLHAPATCKPIVAYKAATAQLLEVRSEPADPESTAGGVTFVVAGMHGGKWSALDAIETAPELDLGVTPHASNDAAIDRFEIQPQPDATYFWIESRHETAETAMGEHTRSGEASTTLCVVPSAASAAPFCYASVPRSAWDYSEAIIHPETGCTIRSVTSFTDQLAAGILTVKLTHGPDLKPVGRFRL
jgi:hypothetical protein